MLRQNGISFVIAGEKIVDLSRAVDVLGESFGIRTLLLEGGGHINGSFLEAELVDEVSLLLLPGIDGRLAMPTVFDGIGAKDKATTALKLKDVERRQGDVLYLRYDVVRSMDEQSRR